MDVKLKRPCGCYCSSPQSFGRIESKRRLRFENFHKFYENLHSAHEILQSVHEILQTAHKTS